MTDTKDFSVILLAGGMGKRMGESTHNKNKNLIKLLGKEVLFYGIKAFESAGVREFVIVSSPDDMAECQRVTESFDSLAFRFAESGKERYDSVMSGLKEVSTEYVLIHDAARCLVTGDVITRSMECAMEHGSGVCAVPSKDTIKVVNDENVVTDTPKRSSLWQAQTPQTFKTSLIKEGYEHAVKSNLCSRLTDDAQTIEFMEKPVHLSMGDYTNIKITEPGDIFYAEAVLRARMEKEYGNC